MGRHMAVVEWSEKWRVVVRAGRKEDAGCAYRSANGTGKSL